MIMNKEIRKIALDAFNESHVVPNNRESMEGFINGFLTCFEWLTTRKQIKGLSFGLFPKSATAICVNPTVNSCYQLLARGETPVAVLDELMYRYALLEKETNELRNAQAHNS